jgi:carbon-monoxide dehydrogenase iron sulfur subunit
MENKEKNISRRKFIKDASVIIGGAAGSTLLLGGCKKEEIVKTVEVTKTVETPKVLGFPPSKGLIAVDVDKCTGCRSCEIACSLYHNGEINPTLARIQIVKDWTAEDSAIEARFLPSTCHQCANALCAIFCPENAIVYDPVTNARIVDEAKCKGDGCKLCVAACPYTPARIKISPITTKAFKCDLCGGDPTCVKVCSSGAITYQFSEEGVV